MRTFSRSDPGEIIMRAGRRVFELFRAGIMLDSRKLANESKPRYMQRWSMYLADEWRYEY